MGGGKFEPGDSWRRLTVDDNLLGEVQREGLSSLPLYLYVVVERTAIDALNFEASANELDLLNHDATAGVGGDAVISTCSAK